MSVLTNVLGLLVAIAFGGSGQGVEEVVVDVGAKLTII
ncbi:hypothetical protein SAMN06272765_8152 [Streptomyces sp. Ag109_G2-15]|nr:hypothetical protein SAMN06272765_8152 [Streptomyces sp. Ag109_G2-15]